MYSTAAQDVRQYEAIVVGAGPAGVTCLGNLLERKLSPILWVDDGFDGGRVNRMYREVPSNTKVGLFVDFATAVAPFRRVVSNATLRDRHDEPSPSDSANGATPDKLQSLRALDQSKGCNLSYAADMVLTLTKGLRNTPGVASERGRLTDASLDESTGQWTTRIGLGREMEDAVITAQTKRLVLCTGSSPNNGPLPVNIPGIANMDLDLALSPTRLHRALSPLGPPTGPKTIAVIGASHSAVLVLMNLYKLASETKPDLRVIWLTRHALRYAEYMDGWILRDNTGLKGEAAAWAKEHLEPGKLENSAVGKYITPVHYKPGTEKETMEKHLVGCDYYVQAIGYTRDPTPKLSTTNGKAIVAQFDHDSGAFTYSGEGAGEAGSKVPGLYGAGIAFPQRVTDPHGNVEYAVGFFKFMKFVKRVSPEWN